MAKRAKVQETIKWSLNPRKMKTSIGKSKNTAPKNKHKKKNYKKYRGQGKG